MTELIEQSKYPRQLSLIGDDVVEITLSVGVVRDSDHVQFQLSVVDPQSGELHELSSAPHVPIESAHSYLSEFWQRMSEALFEATAPF